MSRIICRTLFILLTCSTLLLPSSLWAQSNDTSQPLDSSSNITNTRPAPPPLDEYSHAQVLTVTETPYTPPKQLFKDLVDTVDADQPSGGDHDELAKHPLQTIDAKITQGTESGKTVTITQGGLVPINDNQRVKVGDSVIIVKTWDEASKDPTYHIADFDRLPALGFMALFFFILVVAFGRIKGFTSMLGLVAGLVILTQFIVPHILAGDNPLLVTLAGSVAIAIISLYLAHGFNRRTSIAVVSTLLTLAGAVALAASFVSIGKLFGTGSEDALFLQTGDLKINLQGLFLSGMIIGTLGVLDDITTAQTAVVDELHKANPALSRRELYYRSLSVGKEHIASLVNTLVLAYAGASLPIFLLFKLNNQLPIWFTLNSEVIAEEIVRTLVGSSALILAVPLATLLAALLIPRKGDRTSPHSPSSSHTYVAHHPHGH